MKFLNERLAYVYEQIPTLEGDRGQIGLVKASGASKSMVNQWLSGGIKTMGLEWALQMESNTGFSHIWLMSGMGEPLAKPGQKITIESARQPEPLLTLATHKEMELLDLFRRCTDESQTDIIRYATGAEKRPAARIRGATA